MTAIITTKTPLDDDGRLNRPATPLVQEQLHQQIQESPYEEIRKMAYSIRQGVVILKGRVSSFYLKQLAQTLVRQLDAVRRIENHLEVVYPEERQGSGI